MLNNQKSNDTTLSYIQICVTVTMIIGMAITLIIFPSAIRYTAHNTEKYIKCIPDTTNSYCNYNGICVNNGTCICNYGYTTHKSINNIQCNYEQKNALIAIILQLLLGIFGAGYFYLGNYITANIMLFSTCGSIVLIYVIRKQLKINNNESIIFFIFWYIMMLYSVSLIEITSGRIRDGNGAQISKWY